MTITAALEILRKVGSVTVSQGTLKLRFPETERTELQPVIDVLRNGKPEVIALLDAEESRASGMDVNSLGRRGLQLKGHAVELWRRNERFFIVADEQDSQLVMSHLGASVGEVWT